MGMGRGRAASASSIFGSPQRDRTTAQEATAGAGGGGAAALKRRRKYTIDPHSSFVQRWDLLLTLALLFTSSVTPFEVHPP